MAAIELGIVGLGGMGQTHADNATEHGADVVGGSDVVADARDSFAGAFDATTYEGHEAMYDGEDLDAVVITTPNAFHAPAATAALERNVDVFCEKPLADSLEAAESIAEAARDSDAQCMVGFHNRYSVAGELFVKQREAGRFGDIRHIEVNYLRRRGIPGVGSWFTDDDLSGGGALIDIGVHAIDFGLHLAGFPDVEEVSGVTRTDFGMRADYADPDDWSDNWDTETGTFDVDDSVNALVRFASGATMWLDVSWAANCEAGNSFAVRGTEAGARGSIGGDELELFEAAAGEPDHYVDTELEGTLDPSGHEAEMVDFLEAVETGEALDRNTVEQGLAVQRVIDAIYRSSEAGEAVQIV